MARELRRPKTGYDVLRRKLAEGKDPAGPTGIAAPVSETVDIALPASSEPDRPPEEALAPPPTFVAPPAPAEPPRRRASARAPRRPEAETSKGAAPRASIKFNLSAPAPGAFSLYDQAAAAMGHRKALPALIAKAFEALEAELAAGEALTHMDYPIATAAHRTSSSRMIDPELLEKARRALDPFELLTPTAFGSLLAATALARLLHRRSASIGAQARS